MCLVPKALSMSAGHSLLAVRTLSTFQVSSTTDTSMVACFVAYRKFCQGLIFFSLARDGGCTSKWQWDLACSKVHRWSQVAGLWQDLERWMGGGLLHIVLSYGCPSWMCRGVFLCHTQYYSILNLPGRMLAKTMPCPWWNSFWQTTPASDGLQTITVCMEIRLHHCNVCCDMSAPCHAISWLFSPVSCQTSLGKMEQIAESVELLAGDKGPRFNSLRSLFLARAWVVHQSIWCQSGLSSTSMLATEHGLSCFRWGIFSGWWARWAIVRTICQGDTFSYIWNVVTLLCQSCEVCIHIR